MDTIISQEDWNKLLGLEEFYTINFNINARDNYVSTIHKKYEQGISCNSINDEPSYIGYDPINQDVIIIKIWHMNGLIHRNTGPAVIIYNPDTGLPLVEMWFYSGILYREDDEANLIIYNKNGNINKRLFAETSDKHFRDSWVSKFCKVTWQIWYMNDCYTQCNIIRIL